MERNSEFGGNRKIGLVRGEEFGAKPRVNSREFHSDIPQFDISIILTTHNEARYLSRTLQSIGEAVTYIRPFDVTVEIVVVLDNADTQTSKLIHTHDYQCFDANQIIETHHGAPGLSRNSGISISRGEYILTLDGDDLIGFDFLMRMYFTATSSPRKTIVFPEFCMGFGEICYVYQIFGKNLIRNSLLFDTHPYVARILFPRFLFDHIQNADISVANGYAHEDWHFNSQCIAYGFDIVIASDAVFFYRERKGSMRRLFESQTTGLIPPSPFFNPQTYLRLTWADFTTESHNVVPPFTVRDFLERPGIPDVVHHANQIEPFVSLGILKYQHAFSNFREPSSAARAYFDACKFVAGEKFTEVLIVPFFVRGGAEKYILSLLDVIQKSDPNFQLLVISAHPHAKHEWVDKFPSGTVYLDLQTLGTSQLPLENLEEITLRLPQHIPTINRIFFKNCEFVDSFLRKYIRYIAHLDLNYFHFSDPRVEVGGYMFTNGQSFDLVSEIGSNLNRVISDHKTCFTAFESLIGSAQSPDLEVLYNVCELPEMPLRLQREPTKKLLWAARISEEKRPMLVRKIAQKLSDLGMDICIEAYGSPTYVSMNSEVFDGAIGLNYRGPFNGFSTLPIDNYDALVYTTAYDGLPNVVLEALAFGMPVIAPDVGGISEVVTADTGFLLQDAASEEVLANSFVEAIEVLYDDWSAAVTRGNAGRNLIAEQHSAQRHEARVKAIFSLPSVSDNDNLHISSGAINAN